MSEPSHVRVASLVLALSVVVGGWFLLEYSDQLSRHDVPVQTDGGLNGADTSQPANSQEPKASPAPINPQIFPKSMSLTFKCEKGGRISEVAPRNWTVG